MFEGWAFFLTMWGLWFAFDLWGLVEKREKGYKEEGRGGEVVDIIQAMKMFVLCWIVGITSVIGAFSLGDVADNLVTWYDNYANDTKIAEQDTALDGVADADGTAAQEDMIFHYVTLAMGYLLFTVIAMGGAEFGFHFAKFNDEIECDFNVADSATKQDVVDLIFSMKNAEECYTILPQVQKKMDFNGDGKVSRCENAALLAHMGNSEEYAKKYSFRAVWDAKTECDNLFDPLYY